jgi:hypothetical protein
MVALNPSVSSDLKGDLTVSLRTDSVFAQINKIWERHRKQGLEDRHRTGVLLNEKFGPVNVRQRHGKKVLKDYSAGLGIAVSELSRMRGFAARFVSVADMKTQHPDVKTWTQVKELLASPKKSETRRAPTQMGVDQKKPNGSEPVGHVIRAIQAVRQCMSQVQLAPEGDERAALDDAVKGMLADFEKTLGVRYVLEIPFPAVKFLPQDVNQHASMTAVA